MSLRMTDQLSWPEDGWTAGVSGQLTAVSGTAAAGVSGLPIGVSGVLEDGPPLSCGLEVQ